MLGLWSFNGVDVIGTFHSSLQKNKSAAPDLELMVMPIGISQDNGYAWRKAMGISDQVKTCLQISPIKYLLQIFIKYWKRVILIK